MKIIKRGKILPLECEKCGTIFKPSFREIKAISVSKNYVDCPLCGRSAYVKYEKEVAYNEQSNGM